MNHLYADEDVNDCDDGDNGGNEESDESDEEEVRFTVGKTKLLLAAYRKFQGKMMSGRQKKKTKWAKVSFCLSTTLLNIVLEEFLMSFILF